MWEIIPKHECYAKETIKWLNITNVKFTTIKR